MVFNFGFADAANDTDTAKDDDENASRWQSMSTANRHAHPILLRSKWNGRPVAIVGVWRQEHGSFCTQAIYGEGTQIIHADGWCPLPEF